MLLINNHDVEQLLRTEDCIDVLDDAYRELGAGRAAQFPPEGRMDLRAPSPGVETDRAFYWGAMSAVLPKAGVFAIRQKLDITYKQLHPGGQVTMEKYCVQPGTFCGMVMVVSTQNAEPLAFINDGAMQHMRVGATSGVACNYLARKNSEVLAIVGSGGMARTHAAAFRAVRPIRLIRVYSMTPAHRDAYAEEMRQLLDVEVETVDSAEEAVPGADIVALCTDSLRPIFPDASWVEPGMHITGVLGTDLGIEAVKRADVLIRHFEGPIGYSSVGKDEKRPEGQEVIRGAELPSPMLPDLVAGNVPGRTDDQQVTCFYNAVGAGIQFAAVGARIVELAKARGLGKQIPTEWFLQDIRD